MNQAVIRPHWSRTSPGIVIQIRRRRGIRGICRRAHVVVAVDLDKRNLPELTLVNEALFCLDQVRRATALQTNLDNAVVLAGSGPAYVFLLIEALARAGRAEGLPFDLALQLARATVAGSGELARLSEESPAQLRENVTSPGGTTRAALDVLMAAHGLEPLIGRAVAAAAARSRELAS